MTVFPVGVKHYIRILDFSQKENRALEECPENQVSPGIAALAMAK